MLKFRFRVIYFESNKSEEKKLSVDVSAENLTEARKQLTDIMLAKQYFDWYELSNECIKIEFFNEQNKTK